MILIYQLVGGTMKVYKGEHNSIQMKSEIVIMMFMQNILK